MKVKELYKIFKQLRHSNGCILITKINNKGVGLASLYGDFTVEDLDKYTKGFNNNLK